MCVFTQTAHRFLLLSLGHLCSNMSLHFSGVLHRLRPQNPHQIGDSHCKHTITCVILMYYLNILEHITTVNIWTHFNGAFVL